MKKRLLLLPLLAGLALTGCGKDKGSSDNPGGDPVVVDAVTSVKITGNSAKLSLHTTMQLTAKVTVTGSANKQVTWTSNDSTVATVSSSGLVTPKKVGSVKITATSKFDTSKSASVTIQVVDNGFAPELIDLGYTYSKEFPTAKVEEYLGVEVPEMEGYNDGYYFYKSNGGDGYAPYVEVIMNETEAALYAFYGAFEEDFGYYYDSSYDLEVYIDPTMTYEADFGYAYDEDEEDFGFSIYFYLTEDIWQGSKVKTEDTEWNSKVQSALNSLGVEVPFVALGEDYVAQAGNSVVYIYDGSPNFTLLNGYEAVLIGEGFEAVDVGNKEQSYFVYEKDIDAYSKSVVDFYFDSYGNEIDVYLELKELEAFPSTELGEFVANSIRSNGSIPALVLEGSSFTWSTGKYQMDEEGKDIRDAALIGMSGIELDDLSNYFDLLISEEYGFKLDLENSIHEESGDCYVFTNEEFPRLGVDVLVTYGYREPTEAEISWAMNLTDEEFEELTEEEYALYRDIGMWYIGYGEGILDSDVLGSVTLVAYADPTVFEQAGLYFSESEVSGYIGDAIELEISAHELGEEPEITFESSNVEVATVDAEGVVTLVAEGSAVITASTTVSEVTYETTIAVEVEHNFTVAEILDEYGIEFDYEFVEPENFKFGGEYFDEEYEILQIYGKSSQTAESYLAALAEKGFEEDVDEYGYDIVHDEFFAICAYEEEGYLVIEVNEYVPAAAGVSFDFVTEFDTTSGTSGDFSFASAKGSGQSAPAYNNNEGALRLYAKNTLTISSDGDNVTSIFIEANNCSCEKATGTIVSASTGTLVAVDGGYYWEGDASSVTFTMSASGQVHITLIEINGGGSGGYDVGGIDELLVEVSQMLFGKDDAFKYDATNDLYYAVAPSSKTTLMAACQEVSAVFEEEYYQLQAPKSGTDEDGEYVLAAFCDWSFENIIQVVSYEEDGEICVEIDIYVWED